MIHQAKSRAPMHDTQKWRLRPIRWHDSSLHWNLHTHAKSTMMITMGVCGHRSREKGVRGMQVVARVSVGHTMGKVEKTFADDTGEGIALSHMTINS